MASYLRRGLITIGAVLLFIISSVYLAINIDLRPRTSHIASKSAPGVGFHLTPGYGIAAVRHNDGSLENIGRVDAHPSYREMMKRLSEKDQSITSSTPWYPCYPYTWAPLGTLLDWKVFRRSLRKRLSLPATEDVRLIASLITSLRELTESHLGHVIDVAVPTYTSHESLCPEDFTDAFEYLHLLPLEGGQLERRPVEWFTAYAGHGLGLCQSYTNTSACRAETDAMPRNWTLTVSYTSEALALGVHEYTSAYAVRGYDQGCTNDRSTDFVDYSLGLNSMPPNKYSTDYRQRMRAALIEGARGQWEPQRPPRIDAVIIHGDGQLENPLDEDVRSIIRILQVNVPDVYSGDPLYVAARGAAEFAKRALEWRAQGENMAMEWNEAEDL